MWTKLGLWLWSLVKPWLWRWVRGEVGALLGALWLGFWCLILWLAVKGCT